MTLSNAIWHVPLKENATRFAALLRLIKERLYSFAVIVGLEGPSARFIGTE